MPRPVKMEIDVSDEEYMILEARKRRETDPYAAKAWLLTAKTLFPENFDIQYEVYTNAKNSKNPKDAARYLEDLFIHFQLDSGLWKELQSITDALQTEGLDTSSSFLRDVFSMLPPDVQHEMLLSAADRSEDTQDHCKLSLLLLKKFPEKIVLHGMKLVDTLLSAEKHGHPKSPVNSFRKLLVYDILPLIFKSSGIDLNMKLIYKLLNKCIEFYSSYIMQSPKLSGLSQGSLLGGSECEMSIENPWEQLGLIFNAIGGKLNWELKDLFISSSKEHQWQRIQTFHQGVGGLEENSSFRKQVFFGTCILFLQCLYEYTNKADPEQFTLQTGNNSLPSLILIDCFRSMTESDQPKLKKRKHESENEIPSFHVSKVVQNASTEITYNFLIATRCWDLLHSGDALEKEFRQFQQQLQMDAWNWFQNFQLDRLIYKANYQEAVVKLQQMESYINTTTTHQNKINIRLASCYSAMGMNSKFTSSNVASNVITLNSDCERQLYFINYDRHEVLQFCVRLMFNWLKDITLDSGGNMDDLSLGHLLVLLQYEWPATESVFLQVIEKIKAQGAFSYNLFFNYIIHIDMLEEFAYLANIGDINLDLLPVSTSQIAKQRTVTRGVNKGVKEDLRSAMERQVARCEESLDLLLIQFLTQERSLFHT
uniref:Integrator complex subunit 10 n=1 Tax=Strigamia maritima TaxID=126957 RepID=T1J3C9_STRMM